MHMYTVVVPVHGRACAGESAWNNVEGRRRAAGNAVCGVEVVSASFSFARSDTHAHDEPSCSLSHTQRAS